MKIKQTQLNAVIGYPLLHTLSPSLHNFVYETLGLPATMHAFAHPSVAELVTSIRTFGIGLTAVTMPFKQRVIPVLDQVDREAKKIGAVNTIINRKGKLVGYNTDVFGIEYAFRNTVLKGKRVFIIGGGGAAQAVAYVVVKKGGSCLFANRTSASSKTLRKKYGGGIVTLDLISSEDVDIIVNTTPLGMYPNTGRSPVQRNFFTKNHTVFDTVYNPIETKFLKDAKKQKAKIISGIEMFTAQGLRQIELWTGKKMITEKMVDQLIVKLKKELI